MLDGSCHCGNGKWTFKGHPGSITACNCTLCHRYGTLWAYDYEGERIAVSGELTAYTRADEGSPTLEILFCPTCAGVVAWRSLHLDERGRRRIAVNLRLAALEQVANLPIDHFDGLATFEDLPSDGRCVRDLWA
ncbi:GFA family protein [Ensifer adhaerens]|uniref:GFA family protein n=1 Tax=Ensifer adhaerens TaxID=106592 RepID=UPI000CF108F1|nr:aldehyde-activating protein [Ensifer adhaerens]